MKSLAGRRVALDFIVLTLRCRPYMVMRRVSMVGTRVLDP